MYHWCSVGSAVGRQARQAGREGDRQAGELPASQPASQPVTKAARFREARKHSRNSKKRTLMEGYRMVKTMVEETTEDN